MRFKLFKDLDKDLKEELFEYFEEKLKKKKGNPKFLRYLKEDEDFVELWYSIFLYEGVLYEIDENRSNKYLAGEKTKELAEKLLKK